MSLIILALSAVLSLTTKLEDMSVKKLTSCPLCRLLMSSGYSTSLASKRMSTIQIVNDYEYNKREIAFSTGKKIIIVYN